MNQLEYRKAYNLDELISKIMSGYKKDNFCLYTRNTNHLLERILFVI